MKKTLVFGGNGQLGQCIKNAGILRKFTSLIFLDSSRGDITDSNKLSSLFNEEKPDFVINCAAYTAVDLAEDDLEASQKINEAGPGNLAKICAENEVKLIHISTDFVFAGSHPTPLNEADPTLPVNVYGKTKLAGEIAIQNALMSHYIIRTSWLYSEFGNNFVKTMQRLGREREELGVIFDQIGTPTYAMDLANVILDIVDRDPHKYGTYHYSNEGVASWYDFAKAIFDISEINVKLNPIPALAYPTKATRPSYSVMDKKKIKANLEISIPYWRDSLIRCIDELNKIF